MTERELLQKEVDELHRQHAHQRETIEALQARAAMDSGKIAALSEENHNLADQVGKLQQTVRAYQRQSD